MKTFIVILSALVTIAFAKPSGQIISAIAPAPAVLPYVIGTPIQQQHHYQDAIGQYAYGYSDGLSAKQESKSLDGVTRGGYSYVDANGKLQTVSYIADAINGFRVAATNLPKALPAPEPIPQIAPLPVVDTPEVIAARAAHLRAIDEATIAAAAVPVAPVAPVLPIPSSESIVLKSAEIIPELPKPVEDTPEVAQAKIEHFAAKKDAELRNAAIAANNAVELNIVQPAAIINSLPAVRFAPAIASAAAVAPAIAPLQQIPAFIQPASYFRGYALPSGFGYSYGYANSPFAWDSRFLIASQ